MKYIKKLLDTVYKLQNSPYLHAYVLPLFCDELPKGNQESSSKGGGSGVEPLAPSKFARKA